MKEKIDPDLISRIAERFRRSRNCLVEVQVVQAREGNTNVLHCLAGGSILAPQACTHRLRGEAALVAVRYLPRKE